MTTEEKRDALLVEHVSLTRDVPQLKAKIQPLLKEITRFALAAENSPEKIMFAEAPPHLMCTKFGARHMITFAWPNLQNLEQIAQAVIDYRDAFDRLGQLCIELSLI